jgi:EAL domain-containing protein (putative c-di-GMP-specific phosphodiesterase class I)
MARTRPPCCARPRLLRAAASARAQTRRTGRRRALYDDSLDRDRRSRTSLLPDLQEALQSGAGLSLHYQPKIDLDSGNCTSVEALLRWEHPDRGMVPPGLFVPLVERTALIGPMTQYVLQAAVRQMQFWQTEGIDLRMAVNLSVRNLEEKGLPQRIVDMMRRNDINPAQLEVEVTETALMAAPDRINQALMTLRVQGVTVALDDFGTGHCSLGYLRDLPADTVKLDRSFLVRLDSDERSHVLVGATIETAHRLGFNVVGEGVEEAATLASLRELGCDTGQGYHFARPMPENLLLDWLASRKAKGCAPAHIVADGEPHAAAARPEKR